MKPTTHNQLSLRVRTNLLAGWRKAEDKDCSCRKQSDGTYRCCSDWNWSVNDYELEIFTLNEDELWRMPGICMSKDTYGPHGSPVYG